MAGLHIYAQQFFKRFLLLQICLESVYIYTMIGVKICVYFETPEKKI